MRRALIVVDVQNDFCPGGSLAVAGGSRVAVAISGWLTESPEPYEVVVATMDWHPPPGGAVAFEHFSETPDYATTWPPHCVRGTVGAELHEDLVLPEGVVLVRKGQDGAAYSGFEGHDPAGRPLAAVLGQAGIEAVDVVGLATDYCVKATALDARASGLEVSVLSAMVAGVAPESTARALDELRAAGVHVR